MDFQEVVCGSMDLIELAHNKETRRELVNMVMNFRFHKMWGIS